MPSLIEETLEAQGFTTKGQGTATKNDPPLSPVGPNLHGPNGLFNRRDRENPVFSAITMPMTGVANELPVFNESRFFDDEFGGADAAFDSLITGVTSGDLDSFANQPTQPCQYGPTGGLMKFCTMVNTNGNYSMSTREVNIIRAGRVADAVDAMAVQVANQFPGGIFATPTGTPSLQNAVNNELASRIFEMVVSFQRMLAPRVFTASPANNNGEARDFVGLDIHINSGNKLDARNQNICTAANSDVKSFQSYIVGSASAPDIVRYMEMCDAFAMHRARRQGLGTPDYIIAMRPELWFEISEVIPVQKYERVISVINRVTNGRAMVDASGVHDERNAIRASHLIPLNGRLVRVVEDDAIAETNLGNINGVPSYKGTIYGIPMTALGMPVTFWEYFNHANNQAAAIQNFANMLTWTTDGGMFRWTSDFARGCLKLNAWFTPRLRMRTPQIAWRIDNVGYAPLQHFTDWNPSGSYFVNGGVTTGDSQKYYSSWDTVTPQVPGGL